MDNIKKYFPQLSKLQLEQFAALEDLYKEWNQKINVISRKDIDQLYERHVLHSLSIAKYLNFVKNSSIIDLGTGGGFPGVPLSIFFPNCHFTLIDGTRKKITVVQNIIEELGLSNAKAKHLRAEETKEQYHFVVVRAVASIDKLYGYAQHLIDPKQINAVPNGILALKGGNLDEELSSIKSTYHHKTAIQDYFEEEYFSNKYLVYVQV